MKKHVNFYQWKCLRALSNRMWSCNQTTFTFLCIATDVLYIPFLEKCLQKYDKKGNRIYIEGNLLFCRGFYSRWSWIIMTNYTCHIVSRAVFICNPDQWFYYYNTINSRSACNHSRRRRHHQYSVVAYSA